MAQVPSNLIPTRITQLQEDPSPSDQGWLVYVNNGVTYKVRAADILSLNGVPSSRAVLAGTGLAGGGQLNSDVTISIAPGGVGTSQLAYTGVAAGTYGSSTQIPVVTVDATGRITAATTTSFSITGYVPTTTEVLAGTGLSGGGALTGSVTLNALLTSTTPQSLNTTGTAGVSDEIARADHKHPAVDLADDDQVDGILGLDNGGTGKSIVPSAGAMVWSGADGLYVGPAGTYGKVLMSQGTSGYSWETVVVEAPQQANTVFAGPAAGADATPTYRALVNADLPNSGVVAATYGSATQAAVVAVNSKGVVTSASNTTITPAFSSITNTPTTLAGYGITDAQPLNSGLTDISGLAKTDGNIIVGNGTNWVAESGATARASLGAAASGANADITSMTGVAGGISSPDFIQFDTTPESVLPTTPGALYWDAADGNQTLSLIMAGANGVTQQIGEETYFRIKASSAITEGQVIMATGTVGASGAITGAPASGLTPDTGIYVIGVATENIPLNEWGYVTNFGLVRQIDTTGGAESWVDGTVLYYNPAVAGGLTKNVPAAPNAKVVVAMVVHAASNGSLFVRVSHGSVLGGTDGNVQFGTLVNNDMIVYNGTNNRWENYTPASTRTALDVPTRTGGDASGTWGISITGNAATVTNGVYTTGSYTDPSWITSLSGTKISGNISGNAANVTGTVAVANGGTGQTNYTDGQLLIGNTATGGLSKATLTAGSNITITNGNGTISIAGKAGTVTSVDMTVPTGFSVSGNPITSSGTLALAFASGYSLPTTASQTNWDTAYTDRLKWDGGSTGLVAATGRTSLGATTAGSNLFTLTNPSAVTFLRINADNTVSALGAADFRTAIGAGTGNGTVTSVDVSGGTTGLTTSGGPVTGSGTITLGGTLALANGGTGQTTAQAAINSLAGAVTSGQYLRGNGTNVVMSAIQAGDVPTLNQNTTGSAASLSVTGQTGLLTFTGITSTNRAKTVRDAADTILELGGSYTPTGTWNWTTATVTWPTFNQNTTGTASNVTGTVAIANGGTGQTSQTAAFDALAPTTTKGDLIVFDGSDNVRLAAGTNNYVLTADSTAPAGVKWAASSGTGTVTSVDMTVPTGFAISGNPVTTSGTLALAFASGYSLPTTASQANWDTAYTDRLKWDGGSTGLVAATGRTSLGATTVGSNLFTLANPSAITFPRINADNTVSTLSAADFRTAIGAGTGNGTVTSVDVSGGTTGLTTSGGPVTGSGTITLAGTLAVANGGTGQTSYTDGQLLIGNTATGGLSKATLTAGSNITITNGNGTISIAAAASSVTPTVQTYDTGTAATWTKPASATWVLIEMWGGGGAGGRAGSGNGSGGGGGGAYHYVQVKFADLQGAVTYTVGAGGTAATVNNTAGGAGGTTSVTMATYAGGSNLTVYAYGGGGGSAGSGDFGGGGGGGALSAGGNGGSGVSGTAGGAGAFAGGIGGLDATPQVPGGSSYYGGGGGGSETAVAGNSFYGGGGGGGATGNAATNGGTSVFGGAGGNAAVNSAAPQNGAVPGGGGGSAETANSGAGGRGRVRFTYW